jgi:hypothetical protein
VQQAAWVGPHTGAVVGDDGGRQLNGRDWFPLLLRRWAARLISQLLKVLRPFQAHGLPVSVLAVSISQTSYSNFVSRWYIVIKVFCRSTANYDRQILFGGSWD